MNLCKRINLASISTFTLLLAASLLTVACGGGGGGKKGGGDIKSSVVASVVQSSASSKAVAVGIIKVNQVGFLPSAKKMAIVPASVATTFSVLRQTGRRHKKACS
jgi:endoglucanase